MWAVIEYVATFAECCIYTDFFLKYLKNKIKFPKWLCFSSILICNFVLTAIFNYFMPFEGIFGILRIAMNFGLVCWLMQGSVFEKLFVSCIADISGMLLNLVTIGILSHAYSVSMEFLEGEQGIRRLMLIFISKFLFFLFTRIMIKLKRHEEYHFTIAEWISIIGVFILSMLVGIALFQLNYQQSQSLTAISAGVGLIALNILVYVLMRIISRKNAENTALLLDKMQLDQYKRQFAETEKQYNEMRQIRHDMTNHLQCVIALLDEQDTTKAREYAADLLDNKLKFGSTTIKSGNRIVDVIANTKLAECSSKQIKTAVNLSSFHLTMDDGDICIILGNLLDNAIEACEQDEKERFIFFEISQNKGYVHIIIKNTIAASVLKQNPELLTTKQDSGKHGIGLHSVKSVVQKYGGMIDFYEEHDLFVADVWIPCRN